VLFLLVTHAAGSFLKNLSDNPSENFNRELSSALRSLTALHPPSSLTASAVRCGRMIRTLQDEMVMPFQKSLKFSERRGQLGTDKHQPTYHPQANSVTKVDLTKTKSLESRCAQRGGVGLWSDIGERKRERNRSWQLRGSVRYEVVKSKE
jgi:hypothetical protein